MEQIEDWTFKDHELSMLRFINAKFDEFEENFKNCEFPSFNLDL